jgi:putative glycosyltransferase (TIGR04372 family)
MVYSPVYFLDYWNSKILGGSDHSRPSSNTDSRDVYGILERSKSIMEFTHSEENEVRKWLRRYRIQEGEPFVCLLVRDSAYLTHNTLHANSYDYSYHDYRDSGIDSYNDAIKWLVNNGVYVIRMGKEMNKPITIAHPKIIDYAFCAEKSDLLDVWLFANCNLCISTGSGPDMVSDIYRRPLLFLNYIPISNPITWSNAIHAPKHLVSRITGKNLTLIEHIGHAYMHSKEYTHHNIEIIDLTPLEILSAVKESWCRLQGTWVDTYEDNLRHKKVRNIFDKVHGIRGNFIHEKFRISTSFLRQNKNFV